MPIRRELRVFYGKIWRTIVRPRTLKRAKNRCERCGVPNHAKVKRCAGGMWLDVQVRWHPDGRRAGIERTWRDEAGQPANKPRGAAIRLVTIVLTVAHLNHTPGDDRDENLAAWCQWCHLLYDREHHHQTRATRKDQTRPLLVELEGK